MRKLIRQLAGECTPFFPFFHFAETGTHWRFLSTLWHDLTYLFKGLLWLLPGKQTAGTQLWTQERQAGEESSLDQNDHKRCSNTSSFGGQSQSDSLTDWTKTCEKEVEHNYKVFGLSPWEIKSDKVGHVRVKQHIGFRMLNIRCLRTPGKYTLSTIWKYIILRLKRSLC